jgi:hypothetical protein
VEREVVVREEEDWLDAGESVAVVSGEAVVGER